MMSVRVCMCRGCACLCVRAVSAVVQGGGRAWKIPIFLRRLFAFLQRADQRSVATTELTRAFGALPPQPRVDWSFCLSPVCFPLSPSSPEWIDVFVYTSGQLLWSWWGRGGGALHPSTPCLAWACNLKGAGRLVRQPSWTPARHSRTQPVSLLVLASEVVCSPFLRFLPRWSHARTFMNTRTHISTTSV